MIEKKIRKDFFILMNNEKKKIKNEKIFSLFIYFSFFVKIKDTFYFFLKKNEKLRLLKKNNTI